MQIDSGLKTIFMGSLWACGAFPTPEVVVCQPDGDQRFDVTDLDILAHQWHPFGQTTRLVVDCKNTQKKDKKDSGPSPINRAIWLSGTMKLVKAGTGICVVPRAAPTDHRIAARSQNVILLAVDEVETYLSRTIPVAPLHTLACDQEAWQRFRKQLSSPPPQEELANYLYGKYWIESAPERIRHVLQKTRGCNQSWDSTQPPHSALAAESAALLSLALHEVVIALFSLCGVPSSKEKLAEYLAIHIYGGASEYEFLTQVRRYAIIIKAKTEPTRPSDESSEMIAGPTLPEWDRLLTLIRLGFDNLVHFGPTCQMLRSLAFDYFIGKRPLQDVIGLVPSLSGECCTVASAIFDYLARAGRLSSPIIEILESTLGKIADLMVRK